MALRRRVLRAPTPRHSGAATGVTGLASRGQFEKSAKILGCLNTHDEALQLLALILADNVAAERREFDVDFFLGHWIARIALWNIVAG